MSIEIRPVPPDQLRHWIDTVNVAFGEPTDEAQWELDKQFFEPGRVLGAYDGETLVGGGADFAFRMTVPGGSRVPTAGVTAVGVLPTHRRRGVLTKLMARQLADVRRRGDPLAALVASEGSIYQRFGYGLGCMMGAIDIERERTRFRLDVEPVGTVRLVDKDEARRIAPPLYDLVCSATPGFIERDPAWWDVRLADLPSHRGGAGPAYHAVYERDGEPRGYVRYRVKGEWTPNFSSASVLIVNELLAADAIAQRELWRFIFGVDLVQRITYRWGPPGQPLLLMLGEPRRLQLKLIDAIWIRILDVPAALTARGYAADGSVVLDVRDNFIPEVAGRWRITAQDGTAKVQPTSDPADMVLDVTDLAAVYLGTFTFAELGRAGRTEELTPGARARADALFATTTQPWCSTPF